MNLKEKYKQNYYKGIGNSMPSLTIPGQVMSMKEILKRYTTGQPVMGNVNQGIFDDETVEGIDVDRLSRPDREAYANSKMEEYSDIQERKKMQDESEKLLEDERRISEDKTFEAKVRKIMSLKDDVPSTNNP